MNSQRSIILGIILVLLLLPRGLSAQLTTVRIAFNGFGGVAPLYLGNDAGIFRSVARRHAWSRLNPARFRPLYSVRKRPWLHRRWDSACSWILSKRGSNSPT